MTKNILLAIGSNLTSRAGPPATTVSAAIQALEGFDVQLHTASPLYRTPAFPPGAGPEFINAAVRVSSDLSAADLLEVLHSIEYELGRVRAKRWAQRTVDLDLIAFGNLITPDSATVSDWMHLDLEAQRHRVPDQLIVPHPRMHDRAFVLVPLADVAPEWTHPILGRTVVEMRDALDPDDLASVCALE